jgi:tetratricopeptide (TPR) repeat protein
VVRRVLIVSIVLGWSHFASAAEATGDLVAHGVELRRMGRDAEALAEFKRALAIEKSPRTQAQVALAEQALGLWVEAEEDLLRAFDQKGDPWIKKNLTSLTKALGVIRSHLGTLDLWGSPDGATVLINTRAVGKLPLDRPIRVAGGPVLLTARLDGYLDMTRTVAVPAGATVREHIELYPAAVANAPKRKDAAATAVPSTAKPAAVATGAVRSPSADPIGLRQVTEPSPPSSGLRPLAWAAGIGAAAALAFGVVETVARQHDKAAFENYAFPNPTDPNHPIPDYCNTDSLAPECKPLEDAFNRSNALMIVGYAAGATLAVASAVLFVVSSRGDEGGSRSSAVACVPAVDHGDRLLSCRLDF